MPEKILCYIALSILGYLLGSIMFSPLIMKHFKKMDITKVSSDHNPGAANAFIYGGITCGIASLLLDMLKGFIPVFLAQNFLGSRNNFFILVMIAPVIGHAFPLYKGFHQGGKCIAVSFGTMLGLMPYFRIVILLAFWYIFFSTIIIICPHSLRSVVTYLCFCVSIFFVTSLITIIISCLFTSLIVIIKHLKSLKVMEKKEVRFAFIKR